MGNVRLAVRRIVEQVLDGWNKLLLIPLAVGALEWALNHPFLGPLILLASIAAILFAVVIGYERELQKLSGVQYLLNLDHLEVTFRFPGGKGPIVGAVVGVALKNLADRAIRYDMESMAVEMAGQTVPDPTFDVLGVVVPPGHTDIFRFPEIAGIDVSHLPVRGVVDYTLKYGVASSGESARFRSTKKLEVEVWAKLGDQHPSQLEWKTLEGRDEPVVTAK